MLLQAPPPLGREGTTGSSPAGAYAASEKRVQEWKLGCPYSHGAEGGGGEDESLRRWRNRRTGCGRRRTVRIVRERGEQ